MIALNRIRRKKMKSNLSTIKYCIFNKKFLKNKNEDSIINIKLIFIIVFPTIKLRGIEAIKKLK